MVRQSKSEKSHWKFSSPCVSTESAMPNKITSPYRPGFITLPFRFGGGSRMEILCVAAVWIRVGRYEGLVVERKEFLSGASFSCDPLLTISQRRCKSIGRTQKPQLATTQPRKNFCYSSQQPLKNQNAQLIDCNLDSSRFLALFSFRFSLFVTGSWLMTRLPRSIYSTKRRDCGYHRFFPQLSNPPLLNTESPHYQTT